MKDFTYYLLLEPIWFLAGIILFLFLSLIKSHILSEVQYDVLNRNKDPEQPFNNYSNSLLTALTRAKTYKLTFNYLFKYRAKEWPVIENKAVKLRINIINGLTSFLKPYLIFALCWTLLVYWINSRIFYNELSVTLGEIQQKIVFLKNLKVIEALSEHQSLIFLFYGLLCLVFPFLYTREKSFLPYKKGLTNFLLFLSLIGGVSFFGAKLNNFSDSRTGELKQLEAEIVDLHDKIYSQVLKAVIYEDVKEKIAHQERFYIQEISSLESILNEETDPLLDDETSAEFKASVTTRIFLLRNYFTFENLSIIDDYKSSSRPGYYSKRFTSFNAASDVTTITPEYRYINTKNNWNKQQGNTTLNNLNNFIKTESACSSPFEIKLKKAIDLVVDFGFDNTLSEIYSKLGISEEYKSFRKVLNVFITEKYQQAITDKTFTIITNLQSYTSKAKNLFKRAYYQDELKSAEMGGFVSSNQSYCREQKNKAEIKQLIKNIDQKINSMQIVIPDKADILKNIEIMANRSGINISTEADAIDFLNKLNTGYEYTNEKTLLENIYAVENKAYRDVLIPAVEGLSLLQQKDLLKQNYTLVSNAASNLEIIEALPKVGSRIFDKLCHRCGLPLAFPLCLRKR